MTTPGYPPRWDRSSLAVVVGLCAVKALAHLALAKRYGYHGDELYFLDCGRHLAFGYVDHPPLIPWIARLADELGGGLVTLRVPAIAAGTGTLAFAGLLVREWGGGWRAQLLALSCLLVAPAHLRTAAMLDIPIGLLATPNRRVLASRWPWLGVAVAFISIAPNLAWQVENGFPTLEFMRALRHEVLAGQGRGLFVAGQLLYFHPLAVPVWIAGLVFGLTSRGRAARPFGVLFVALFGFYLVAGGKPYYLASAYPPVLAAGGIALERWFAQRVATQRTLSAALAVTGGAFGVVTLPLLPIQKIDAVLAAVLGWAVPPMALTHDLHGMIGWEQHVATIERVYRSLPENERGRASVLAGTYAQASGEPRAASHTNRAVLYARAHSAANRAAHYCSQASGEGG